MKLELHKAYLLLGTNEGDRVNNLAIAEKIITEQIGKIIAQSSLYETAAWGKTDQPDFLNRAILIETYLSAKQLLISLLAIEKEMGRVRLEKWGQRLIDLDIIFYEDLVCEDLILNLPHPEMHKRKFVLVPLCEIAPKLIHPKLQLSINEILNNLDDNLEVKKYKTNFKHD